MRDGTTSSVAVFASPGRRRRGHELGGGGNEPQARALDLGAAPGPGDAAGLLARLFGPALEVPGRVGGRAPARPAADGARLLRPDRDGPEEPDRLVVRALVRLDASVHAPGACRGVVALQPALRGSA